MKITIISAWKQKKVFTQIEKEYLKRLGRYAVMELKEFKGEKGDGSEALKREGKKILSRLENKAYIVVLTEKAEPFSSTGFARWLESMIEKGNSQISFVLGSSSGVDKAVTARADMELSLSPLTFPHALARVLLIEQVYRAFTLIRGEPYHK